MKSTLSSGMRKFLSFLLISTFSFSYASFRDLPKNLSGSMMPYDFSAADTTLPIPDSLEVTHICYVARHGARFISSESKVSKLTDILERQSEEGKISDSGREFLSLLRKVTDATHSRWGDLSDVGIEEERRLGSEMATLFPALFERGEVSAKSTYVPRVVSTMYCFLSALERINQNLDIETLSGHANDSILRCFDYYHDYAGYRENGEWKKVYRNFVNSHVSAIPACKIFGISAENEEKAKSLTMDIYSVLQAFEAFAMPAPTDQWMTPEQYHACWEAANLQLYLRNTLNPLSEAYVKASADLIKAIIEDADRYSVPESVRPLSAWFGHAETLMPMLSLMDIPGCNYYTDDWNSVASRWKSQEVVPLGANFMLILLCPKNTNSNSVYAMVRLNGRLIRLSSAGSFLISWPELKSRWISRL